MNSGMKAPMKEFRSWLDRTVRGLSNEDYRELLDEIGSEVEIREMALREEEETGGED